VSGDGRGVVWSDERLRRELLRRYSGGDLSSGARRLKFHLKRGAWTAVVRGTHVAKRLLDVVGAAVLLVLLAPFLALVALLVRLDSPGPVLFPQTRVGRFGALFTMWKFRSMYRDAEQRKAALLAQNEMAGGVIFKMKDDPRVTRVGRFIRKGSIDELPQLWNVLKGDMSLVGPRPPVPREVAEYTLADRRRLEVTPGITCIWQVSGRSDIPFPQQVELDVAYIESQSLWLDLVLLLRTVPAVLFSRGAY
jgi:exopolysaccharide biosynthesis polyprenyl glycosylphosphotransferase